MRRCVSITTGEEVGGAPIKVHLEQVQVRLNESLLKGVLSSLWIVFISRLKFLDFSTKVHLEQIQVCLNEILFKGGLFTPVLILFCLFFFFFFSFFFSIGHWSQRNLWAIRHVPQSTILCKTHLKSEQFSTKMDVWSCWEFRRSKDWMSSNCRIVSFIISIIFHLCHSLTKGVFVSSIIDYY